MVVISFCAPCFKSYKVHRRDKRRQKIIRRRRRRSHQRNCQGAIDDDPPSPNPRSQQGVSRNTPVPPLPNVAPQQQEADRCACGFPQTFNPLPFLHQQHSNFLHQLWPAEQYALAQQPQLSNLNMPGQQPESELPPPYEPPKYQPNEGQHETRELQQEIDINQFFLPPPPPYDEHPQQRTPIVFK
ncbi:hypothetical protein TNCT_531221 [Trichonephila clavata]|uniref:Uncharacterized protein n=1 Tax=Trichonephila clavata TaxID=2740835 RepID=A0A8X6GTR8_TRICU|nr:hypothetical protein TNCT_531221 [Trichonephila clavata]